MRIRASALHPAPAARRVRVSVADLAGWTVLAALTVVGWRLASASSAPPVVHGQSAPPVASPRASAATVTSLPAPAASSTAVTVLAEQVEASPVPPSNTAPPPATAPAPATAPPSNTAPPSDTASAAAPPTVAADGWVESLARVSGRRVRVVLVGDSLAAEAAPTFSYALEHSGRFDVRSLTKGGSALCDLADDALALVRSWRADVVVASFSGNNLTACMRDPLTGNGFVGQALAARYERDAIDFDAALSTGVRVLWVGSPVSKAQEGTPDDGLVSRVLRDVAAGDGSAAFVDAGRAVLGPEGRWTATLPCALSEPCPEGGQVVVRAPDGAHFCPVRYVAGSSCPVWSSGAWRFGMAMAGPLLDGANR